MAGEAAGLQGPGPTASRLALAEFPYRHPLQLDQQVHAARHQLANSALAAYLPLPPSPKRRETETRQRVEIQQGRQ